VILRAPFQKAQHSVPQQKAGTLHHRESERIAEERRGKGFTTNDIDENARLRLSAGGAVGFKDREIGKMGQAREVGSQEKTEHRRTG